MSLRDAMQRFIRPGFGSVTVHGVIPREMEHREAVLARLHALLRIPLGELEDSLARVPL